MLNIGGGELLIIFLVALIVLGPGKLPDAARQAGQVMREFRRISSGFQRELKDALDDPVSAATREPAPKSTLAAAPADVSVDADLPPIETPEATSAVSGDDPETRRARAESLSSTTEPINPAADPFTGADAADDDASSSDEGMSGDR